MAVDLPKVHEQALQHTARYVAGVKGDQWDGPTPDDEWDVRALVNHVVSGNFWVAPLVGGKTIEEVGDRYNGDILGDDPSAAYEESAKEAAAAFNAKGAMQAPCAVSYGPVPGEIYAGHRFIDVLIHGWDLAKATGQDYDPDPASVDGARQFLNGFANPDAPAGPDVAFGPPRSVGAGATALDEVVALCGRDPGWAP